MISTLEDFSSPSGHSSRETQFFGNAGQGPGWYLQTSRTPREKFINSERLNFLGFLAVSCPTYQLSVFRGSVWSYHRRLVAP